MQFSTSMNENPEQVALEHQVQLSVDRCERGGSSETRFTIRHFITVTCWSLLSRLWFSISSSRLDLLFALILSDYRERISTTSFEATNGEEVRGQPDCVNHFVRKKLVLTPKSCLVPTLHVSECPLGLYFSELELFSSVTDDKSHSFPLS